MRKNMVLDGVDQWKALYLLKQKIIVKMNEIIQFGQIGQQMEKIKMEQQQQTQTIIKSNSTCLIVIGMSGTGKTTFVSKLYSTYSNLYPINLDPAVKVLPYQPFIDIRETHEYKKVMKEYKLGPNGAILTALNLYLAQPELIVNKIQAKLNDINKLSQQQQPNKSIFLIDIPGQIEVFTWSASSLILVSAIATIMPVKILYTIDTVRCQNPNVFLSNLLFSQSIKYRFPKFQFILLLNKSDAGDGDKLIRWIKDYEEFMTALQQDPTYLATLSKSIVLHLSQFYQNVKCAKVSAKTGFGLEEVQKLADCKFIKR